MHRAPKCNLSLKRFTVEVNSNVKQVTGARTASRKVRIMATPLLDAPEFLIGYIPVVTGIMLLFVKGICVVVYLDVFIKSCRIKI